MTSVDTAQLGVQLASTCSLNHSLKILSSPSLGCMI